LETVAVECYSGVQYAARSAKLEQATKLIKEALSA
jgi:hypothetical protein